MCTTRYSELRTGIKENDSFYYLFMYTILTKSVQKIIKVCFSLKNVRSLSGIC